MYIDAMLTAILAFIMRGFFWSSKHRSYGFCLMMTTIKYHMISVMAD